MRAHACLLLASLTSISTARQITCALYNPLSARRRSSRGRVALLAPRAGAGGGGVGVGVGVGVGGGGGGGASSYTLARTREGVRRLGAGYASLARFLRGFVEESDGDFRRVWRERTLAQRLADIPPDMIGEAVGLSAISGADAVEMGGAGGGIVGGVAGVGGGGGRPPHAFLGRGVDSSATPAAGDATGGRVTVIMRDTSRGWEHALFRGIEWDLLLLDGAVFCAADAALGGSPAVAALVSWLAAAALAALRHELGRRNVARKSLASAGRGGEGGGGGGGRGRLSPTNRHLRSLLPQIDVRFIGL